MKIYHSEMLNFFKLEQKLRILAVLVKTQRQKNYENY